MKSVKVDGAFPDSGTRELGKYLAEGWVVYDRISVGDRYVTYLLKKK